MSAPLISRDIQTASSRRKAGQAPDRKESMSRHRQPNALATAADGPHRLYVAIDAIAQTEWSDQDEFEAQVLQTERQIEVHLNEIILESVTLLKQARARHSSLKEASAHQADVVIACEALRDRALEKRRDLLEELELAVDAGRRSVSQACMPQ